MNSFSPWKRKRPEREDIDTKSAALKASPSVVSLTSLTGGKMMFACSGTIIECEDVNGTFINTVLTFATLLRSPIDANAIPYDIKLKNLLLFFWVGMTYYYCRLRLIFM
ncbi:hypothetical protein ACSBR1_020808 [Camellia fascicularis]